MNELLFNDASPTNLHIVTSTIFNMCNSSFFIAHRPNAVYTVSEKVHPLTFVRPSVRSFVCLLPPCECYILQTNEPISMQIDTNLQGSKAAEVRFKGLGETSFST